MVCYHYPLTFSASSNSAIFAIDSALTFEPNTCKKEQKAVVPHLASLSLSLCLHLFVSFSVFLSVCFSPSPPLSFYLGLCLPVSPPLSFSLGLCVSACFSPSFSLPLLLCLSLLVFVCLPVSLPPGFFITHLDLFHAYSCAGEENASVLKPLGLVHAILLLQQEPCITTSQGK